MTTDAKPIHTSDLRRMNMLYIFLANLRRQPRRRLIRRSLLASPFAASLILTVLLGPGTINSVHGSFVGLAVLSLAGTLLMFAAAQALLIPIGIVAFLVFPPVAGLGFNFAPAWARPIVVVIFYASMLASAAAVLSAAARIWPRRIRRRSRAIAAVGLMLLALAALASIRSTPAGAAPSAAGSDTLPLNMGSIINTGQREAEPSFTADGRTMVYNCRSADICLSHLTGTWEKGQWSAPQLLGSPISTAYTEVEPWINSAGDKLYFNSSRPFARGESLPGLALYVDAVGLISQGLGVSSFDGLGEDDIWVSYLVDGAWSEPRNINDIPGEPHINTAYLDHCLAFSADGNEAFWTSTRPGGYGRDDIWTARRVDGSWTAPENLGPSVNGPWIEHHSMPTPDGRSLYVTSNRPVGFGGEDTYVTTRGADGRWGPLVNLRAPINGPANDRCPAWTPDGRIVLFDSDRAGGFGSKDLWWLYSRP